MKLIVFSGLPVILDSVVSTQSIRETWFHLSQQYQVGWRVIECICSDESFHRSQLVRRERKIPGWHELGWSDVEKAREYFLPWDEKHLVLDMIRPFEENFTKTICYCKGNSIL